MQGDPMFTTRPITSDNLKQMERAARDWSAKDKIDPVSNLANQAAVSYTHLDVYKRQLSRHPLKSLFQWHGHDGRYWSATTASCLRFKTQNSRPP